MSYCSNKKLDINGSKRHKVNVDKCNHIWISLYNPNILKSTDYRLLIKINPHTPRCSEIAPNDKRHSVYSMLCRNIDPFTLLKPKQLMNEVFPHPRYLKDHTAMEWDAYYSLGRMRSLKQTIFHNQLRSMGCKTFTAFNMFKEGIPDGFKENVIYAEVHKYQTCLAVIDKETMEFLTESFVNKNCFDWKSTEAVKNVLKKQPNIAAQIAKHYHTIDSTFKIGLKHNYNLTDNMSLFEEINKILPFLYVLTSPHENVISHALNFGFFIQYLLVKVPNMQQLVRTLLTCSDLCSKIRAGWWLSSAWHLKGEWTNLVENNSIIKSCYDESGQLKTKELNERQQFTKEWLKANKLDDIFENDIIHEAKQPEKMAKGMTTAESIEFCGAMKDLLLYETFDKGIIAMNKVFVTYKDHPIVGGIIKRLFLDVYWVKLNYTWMRNAKPCRIIQGLLLNHSNHIENLHMVQYLEALNQSLPPVSCINLLTKKMRNNRRAFIENKGNYNKQYGEIVDIRKKNTQKYFQRKKKSIRSPLNGGNIELLRKHNVLKKGLKYYDCDTKYNPNKFKHTIRLWHFRSTSLLLSNTVISNHLIPGLISNKGKNGLASYKVNRWLVKCIHTAIKINENIRKLKYLKQIAMDQLYGTNNMATFTNDIWRELLKYIFSLKDTYNHVNTWNKLFVNASDLGMFDANNYSANKKLIKILKDNNIILNIRLINNTSKNVNNYIFEPAYVKLAQSFLKCANISSSSDANPVMETFLLSEYNSTKFLVNISCLNGKIIMGWYSEHMPDKLVKSERAPSAMNASQLVLTGMAFNMGYTDAKQKIHKTMNDIKNLCLSMEYGSDAYLQCIIDFVSNNRDDEKYVGFIPEFVFGTYNVNDIKMTQDLKIILKDNRNVNIINDLARKIIHNNITTISKRELSDPSITNTFNSILHSLNRFQVLHSLVVIDNKHKNYKLYLEMVKSVTLACNRIILQNKHSTIQMGLYLMKITEKNDYDSYYENIANENNNQLHSDISIIANKIKNGTDSILTSSSLMNKDAIPIQFNTQINTTRQYNIESDYRFLQLCNRSLNNFINGDEIKVCIEGSDDNINDTDKDIVDNASFVCSNCNILIHVKCVFPNNTQFYYKNEDKEWVCGCCSGLQQFNGAIYVESYDEKQFGQQIIENTINGVSKRINDKINTDLCGMGNSAYSEYLQIVFNTNEIKLFLLTNYSKTNAKTLAYWTGIAISDMINTTILSDIYNESFHEIINNYSTLQQLVNNHSSQTLITKHLLEILIADINDINQQQTTISFINVDEMLQNFNVKDKNEMDECELLQLIDKNVLLSDIICFYCDHKQQETFPVETFSDSHYLQIITNNNNNMTMSIVFDLCKNIRFTIKNKLLLSASDVSNYNGCWNCVVFTGKKYKLKFENKNVLHVNSLPSNMDNNNMLNSIGITSNICQSSSINIFATPPASMKYSTSQTQFQQTHSSNINPILSLPLLNRSFKQIKSSIAPVTLNDSSVVTASMIEPKEQLQTITVSGNKKRTRTQINKPKKRKKKENYIKINGNKAHYYNNIKKPYGCLANDYSNVWVNTQNMNEKELKIHLKNNLKSDQMRDFCSYRNIPVGRVNKPIMIAKLVNDHLK